jgi:hypothetical protein
METFQTIIQMDGIWSKPWFHQEVAKGFIFGIQIQPNAI